MSLCELVLQQVRSCFLALLCSAWDAESWPGRLEYRAAGPVCPNTLALGRVSVHCELNVSLCELNEHSAVREVLLGGWAVAEAASWRNEKPMGVMAAVEVGDMSVHEGA